MTKPLSPEILVYGLTQASDPRISPDGSQVLYTRSQTSPESHKTSSQVWVVRCDGSDARQLTQSGERNGGARWSPDGLSVAFVSDRVEEAGVVVLPMRGGEAREVTKHHSPVSDLDWSPDGSRLVYTVAVDPDAAEDEVPDNDAAAPVRVTRRIDYKQGGRGYLHDKRFQTFVVDVESGETKKVSTDVADYNFPSWSPDGTNVTLTGDSSLTWQTDFYVYEVASGALSQLTSDLQCLPAGGQPGMQGPAQPLCREDGTVLFHAMHRGAGMLDRLQVATGKVEAVSGAQAMPNGFSATADGQTIVQACTSLESSLEVLLHDLRTGDSRRLTREGAKVLDESPPARWERFDVTRDGSTTEAWALMSADFDPARKYPVILDVHGGPNGFYGYGFVPMQQCLATNGFILVFSNLRGSSSYGREFTRQVIGDWGGEDYHDLMAVVDKVLERDYADGDRVGICGGTAMVVT